jgi:hypothetical protein
VLPMLSDTLPLDFDALRSEPDDDDPLDGSEGASSDPDELDDKPVVESLDADDDSWVSVGGVSSLLALLLVMASNSGISLRSLESD